MEVNVHRDPINHSLKSYEAVGWGGFALLYYTTGNCQLSVFRWYSLISKHELKKRKSIIKALWEKSEKQPLGLFDINEALVGQLKEMFKTIILDSPYVSANNSHMRLVIVDLREIKDWA